MTISTDLASTGPFTPNSVATVFAFDFQAASAAEVGVIVGTTVLDSGAYTVTLEADKTGSVTISPALDATDGDIYIFSEPYFEQNADFQRFGPYFPDTLNPHRPRRDPGHLSQGSDAPIHSRRRRRHRGSVVFERHRRVDRGRRGGASR